MSLLDTDGNIALSSFFRNPVFLSAIFSMITAQFIKAVIILVRPKARSFKNLVFTLLWRTGGMPSSHSSLVVSITTAIGFTSGIGSNVFILALFFALVVIRDAVGVRRSTGIQARAINSMGAAMTDRFDIPFHPVKEVHGHTIPQVIAGGLLGFFIALAFCVL